MYWLKSTYENNIWKYYLFEFFRGTFFIGGVLVPFFTDWGKLNQTQIQTIQSVFMLSLLLAEIPTGVVADYWGRKQSLAIGQLVLVIAVLIYSLNPSFQLFILAEIIAGIAFAFYSGANQALVYDSLKFMGKEKEFKLIWGRTTLFVRLASGFSAIIGSWIAAYFGFRYVMLFSSIPFFCGFLVSLTLKEPKNTESHESERYIIILKKGIKNLFQNKILLILAFDSILINILAYFVIWLYQPQLKLIGIELKYFGYFAFLLNIIQVILVNLPGRLEKILRGKRNVLIFGAWSTAITFILVGIFPSTLTIILLILFAGGFGLTRGVMMAPYLNRLIPSSERATTMSSISMIRQFFLVILNPIVGYLTDWNLNYTLIIIGLTGLAIAFFSQIEEEMLLE